MTLPSREGVEAALYVYHEGHSMQKAIETYIAIDVAPLQQELERLRGLLKALAWSSGQEDTKDD